MENISDRTLRLGAYLLIVVIGIVGFWQIEQANDNTDQSAREAAYNLCVKNNEQNKAIRDLVSLGRPLQAPPYADQGFKDYLAQSNQRNAEFRNVVSEKLADEPCPPNPFTDR